MRELVEEMSGNIWILTIFYKVFFKNLENSLSNILPLFNSFLVGQLGKNYKLSYIAYFDSKTFIKKSKIKKGGTSRPRGKRVQILV